MSPSHVPSGSIVVGVDGSAGADRAIVWAAQQAALENRTLVLLHSGDISSTLDAYVGELEPAIQWGELRKALETTADTVLARADGLVTTPHHPGLETILVLSRFAPREALLAASVHAHLLVVGSRSSSHFANLVLGSVAATVAARSTCPAVVVGPETPDVRPARVVVGARFATGSAPVIEYAFTQASTRGLPLTVAHCYVDTESDHTAERHDLDDLREQLSESVAGLGEKYPDVEVDLDLTTGSFHDLVSVAGLDALVVIGRRSGSRLDQMIGTWSTLGIVDDAGGVVIVVPETAS